MAPETTDADDEHSGVNEPCHAASAVVDWTTAVHEEARRGDVAWARACCREHSDCVVAELSEGSMTTVVGLVFAITCLAAEGDRTAIQAVRKHWFDLRASETTGATLVFDHSEVVDSGRTRTEYSIVWGPRKGNFSAIAKGEAYRSHLAITAVKASWRYSDNTVVDHVFECSLKAPLNDAERWALDRGFLIHDWKSAERSSFAQLEAVLASAKSSETLMPGNYAFHATKAGEILFRCSPRSIEVVRRGNTERLLCRYAVGDAEVEEVARRANDLFQQLKNDSRNGHRSPSRRSRVRPYSIDGSTPVALRDATKGVGRRSAGLRATVEPAVPHGRRARGQG